MKYFKIPVLLIFLVFCSCKSTAQQDFDPAYVKVTNERAQKIVDNLAISNTKKELKVRDLIAGQYRALSKIQENEEAELAVVKTSKMSEELKQSKKEAITSKVDAETKKLHKQYLKSLKKQLNDKQVTEVKDGMTYGVVEITYEGYQDMLPELLKEEKEYIYKNLVEARELAMDAGSSKEKHAWFGKYKGRINNYLSQRGYDLNAESEAWHKRIEARKKEENNN
ncbi:DUF3826 domain-containing protein [Leeuwenhoekiella marinoflava]|uniref:DUF3826 domain-containing protein n=2 Tax=Leeuwenhoekiella marinoflava TaxID=988 RepID=A0A4Q0PP23_9FLAO|nr:DUF3826 domain-containing protein [Leeuwenhoekiella marinoflava]RXG32201.1 putative protein DUF3826 [Leeuwenhoekiella marinoflava]SHE83565.1 Protein of unknown function [Leeuwenhoekiella marinoflava DSM 3653]